MSERTKFLGNIRSQYPQSMYHALEREFESNNYEDYIYLNDRYFPLLAAVSAAGKKDFLVLCLNYSKLRTANKILIGKGIMFDSGGIQSKGNHMDGMFFDKLGAVITIDYCLKNPEIPGVVFFTNNLVSEDSYLPGEIIESDQGVRVLIDHTDAEGRLGLADLLEYAEEQNPKAEKITVATLTGAAVRFTAENTFALLHTYRKDLKIKAIEQGVKIWPAPEHKDYRKALKTKVIGADIRSCGNLDGAGSQTAYQFLKHFCKKLTHLDIAGMYVKDNNYTGEGYEEVDFLIKN